MWPFPKPRPASSSTPSLRCSFGGKDQQAVQKLMAGPAVYICDECIELSNDILTEEFAEEAERNLTGGRMDRAYDHRLAAGTCRDDAQGRGSGADGDDPSRHD